MKRYGRLNIVLLVGLGLFTSLGLWIFVPRAAHPDDFDPDTMARLETEMWQAYYAKDYPTLTLKLWEAVRSQFGGSPYTSFQIALHASEAARLFQASTSREQAQDALPALQSYYTLLQAQTGRQFDPDEAALLELEWWQLRREHASSAEVAQVIARLYAIVNNATPEAMYECAHQRVEAMAYRDARRQSGLSAEEWDTLEQMLRLSYRNLKANINPS